MYVILEYMDYGSLDDVLKRCSCIPEAIMANITAQVAFCEGPRVSVLSSQEYGVAEEYT